MLEGTFLLPLVSTSLNNNWKVCLQLFVYRLSRKPSFQMKLCHCVLAEQFEYYHLKKEIEYPSPICRTGMDESA